MRPDQLSRIADDPAVFEAFYRKHVDAVLRSVTRRVGDPHLAADLTADVFLAAIDAAPSYTPARGAPVAWLFGIVRNVVAADRRRSARERQAHARVQGRRLLDDEDLIRMEERIDAAARARELYAAMEQLPESERAVLELVALDGLSAAEAAAVLGIRPIAARVRLHRARKALRQLVADDAPSIPQPMEA